MTYAEMQPGEMLQAVGDDGMKWAEAFHERFPQVSVEDAFGWFANAIENTWDTRCSRLTRSDEAWNSFREQVESHRQLWRELEHG